MEKINWGIIGCGDVTEIKSGPAFNKVKNSALVAVMRRDEKKAQDYARRHHVGKWYSDAMQLINDDEVNAVYVATPPSTHEYYTLAAIDAGKPVYVEKPMTMNFNSALKMVNAANERNIKLSVAHYRRQQPYFKKIKELITDKVIGDIRVVQLNFYKGSLSHAELNLPGNAWRVNAAVSGGGLFHDLAPHQLDLMYYFFGGVKSASGISVNQDDQYNADDAVAGNILFTNGIIFNGLWCFNVDEKQERDNCEIIGSNGSINFSVFGAQNISITINGNTEVISFEALQHVQQPMIEAVVEYFLGTAPNPSSGEDGSEVMLLMDKFTEK